MARKKRSRAQAAELPIHDEAASSAQHDGRVASINPPPTMATGSCNAQLEVPKHHVSNLSGRRIRTASLNALTIAGSPQTVCSETWVRLILGLGRQLSPHVHTYACFRPVYSC